MSWKDKWRVSESGRSASVSKPGHEVEIEIDDDSLEVRIDEGRGYMAHSMAAYIPIEVLRRLLDAAAQMKSEDRNGR